jgi:hypothetical protein
VTASRRLWRWPTTLPTSSSSTIRSTTRGGTGSQPDLASRSRGRDKATPHLSTSSNTTCFRPIRTLIGSGPSSTVRGHEHTGSGCRKLIGTGSTTSTAVEKSFRLSSRGTSASGGPRAIVHRRVDRPPCALTPLVSCPPQCLRSRRSRPRQHLHSRRFLPQ